MGLSVFRRLVYLLSFAYSSVLVLVLFPLLCVHYTPSIIFHDDLPFQCPHSAAHRVSLSLSLS
jgi:hypothetical protein